MVGDTSARAGRSSRDGRAVLAGVTSSMPPKRGNPRFAALGVDQALERAAVGRQHGRQGVRFGIANSALFATVTTDASCGAVNAMHDSFTPLGGIVPMINIQLGEIIFGGVGSGLYGMLLFVISRSSSPA
jgi:K+-transporting ATPase ATPase A chain